MRTIAPMTPADLEVALDWAAAEGWNPGLEDAAAFHAADPRGFLMARVEGAPVACISVVRHAPDFGFLGLYICKPDRRGQGHGWAVWQAGLAHLGERAIGLDGVAALQENYRRSGFVAAGRTIRFLGAIDPGPAEGLVRVDGRQPDVAALDRRAAGIDRPAFLAAWLGDTPTRRSLALVRDGRATSFGTVRRCREGIKVGPLFAPGRAEAERLLRGLAGLFPDRPLALDVPEGNPQALALAAELGLRPVFETARMYRGPAPTGDRGLAWGVATLELG